MKRIPAIVIALVALFSIDAAADTVHDTFGRGVKQYLEASNPGDYAVAADTFKTLSGTFHVNSPDVLLDLGASEFLSSDDGQDRTGEAMLVLHRAVRAAPDSLAAGLAKKNLETIRRSLNEKHSGKGGSGYVFAPYNDGWTALFSWLPPDVARVAFLSLWLLLFVVLAVRRLFQGRTLVVLASVLAVLAAIAGAGAIGASRVEAYTTGVVLEDAPVYDDFISISPHGELPEGLEFRLLERRDQRLRIRLSSGETGWVSEDRVGIP